MPLAIDATRQERDGGRHPPSFQTYWMRADAGKNPGAAGKVHLAVVDNASVSKILCAGVGPLVPVTATRVTFPSALTSYSRVVVPSAALSRASAG